MSEQEQQKDATVQEAKTVIESAAAWVPMCQPSASSAIEPNRDPAPISIIIIKTVIIMTNQILRSP